MNIQTFLFELQNTETMIFKIASEPHVPGVGDLLFVNLGRFNKKNAIDIQFIAEFPDVNSFNLRAVGERAKEPLSKRDIRVLLDFFEPYFLHSYSREEFVGYLKDKEARHL